MNGRLLVTGAAAAALAMASWWSHGATATATGAGISGKAAGLKLKAGAKNTITMKSAKAAAGNATFEIVLRTNGRPTTETKGVTVTPRRRTREVRRFTTDDGGVA